MTVQQLALSSAMQSKSRTAHDAWHSTSLIATRNPVARAEATAQDTGYWPPVLNNKLGRVLFLAALRTICAGSWHANACPGFAESWTLLFQIMADCAVSNYGMVLSPGGSALWSCVGLIRVLMSVAGQAGHRAGTTCQFATQGQEHQVKEPEKTLTVLEVSSSASHCDA